MGAKLSTQPVVFFGTGPVAAQSLDLLAKNFVIEAVVTKPRPAHHRGATPVIDVARKLNLPVHTAANRHELDTLFNQRLFTSSLGVLIDFGIIVSQAVLDYFPNGIINSHFSILPDLRGADPITFAILSGQSQTGVSIMKMVAAMDEGPLIGYGEYNLPPNITTPELTQNLILLSDALLAHDLPSILEGHAKDGVPQSTTKRHVSYSRRLTKDDGIIDWTKPAEILEREIRAFLGWPGSKAMLRDKEVTITAAKVVSASLNPGQIEFSRKGLVVGTQKDGLAIIRLKPSGKKEMDIESFLAGYRKSLTSN